MLKRLFKNKRELFLILLHLAIGFSVFVLPFLSKLLSLIVLFGSFFVVLVARNKTFAVLLCCAYVATSDVFFRMTGGLFFYELHKYLLIALPLLAIVYDFASVKGYVYLVYILLLLSTIVITEYNLNDEVRKMIAFNLSGPVSLGFFAFFCYKKKVTMKQLSKVFLYSALPVVSIAVYLFLYNPSVKEVVTGTASNFATSGGFGPNQVATILGAGIFVFITRLIINKMSKIQMLIEFSILCVIVFRGLVTFSRGGILVALIASIVFCAMVFLKGNSKYVLKVVRMFAFFVISGVVLWLYTVSRTSGLIENRYTNKNALGQEKKDVTTGRKQLILVEFQAFFENPVFGIGVGKNKEYRQERTGIVAASHNEFSRILAEHGTFGLVAFLILLLTPLILRLENRNNIYFYSCLIIWLLTINHSAMRIAFPSFIYGLAVLDVHFEKKRPIEAKKKALQS
ncbi:O-antigen ligase family protein [Pseudofulvibacter geojedonensis]|uniref:O-antigen ligase family protein n=1 Tax=Pseudofulvibacter geojedonensis TaxID=1123758 RepID=A0ABW3HYF1_9FLAO